MYTPGKIKEAQEKRDTIKQQQEEEEAQKAADKLQKQLQKEERERLAAQRKAATAEKRRLAANQRAEKAQAVAERKEQQLVNQQLKIEAKQSKKWPYNKKNRIDPSESKVVVVEDLDSVQRPISGQTRSGRNTKRPKHLEDCII